MASLGLMVAVSFMNPTGRPLAARVYTSQSRAGVGYWRPGGFAVSMKVFVTGAAGFSGFHVARALLAREDEGWGSIM